jgi:DNA invertase Pin-like site-specific DNA recombinase
MDEYMKAAIRAHRAALRARTRLSELAAKRDQAVRAALDNGHTQTEIAKALGVDRARINRIDKETK